MAGIEAGRDENYARAGFGNRMGFGERPALLIVDLNLGMTDPRSPMAMELDEVIAANVRLIQAARAKKVPVVYSTNRYQKGCWDAGIRLKKMKKMSIYEEGTGFSEIDERVKPLLSDHVIVKKYSSAFWGTGLASLLVSMNVDTVIITGTATSGCVRASAMDCINSGFYTSVVEEAVGDRSPVAHAQNLFDIGQKMADVISLQESLNYIGTRIDLPHLNSRGSSLDET
jgi:maleamate amidohydrolase